MPKPALKVTVRTPQLDDLVTLDVEEVAPWMAAHGFVGKWDRRHGWIAVPEALEAELRRAERGEIPLVLGSQVRGNPVLHLDRVLHLHGRFVYMPVERAGAQLWGAYSFFRGVDELVRELSEARVSVPAGVYGVRDVKHPPRALPIHYAFGMCTDGPRDPDPRTWTATQSVLRDQAERHRLQQRVRRRLRKAEKESGLRLPDRDGAEFTEENDHNPWVRVRCPVCGECSGSDEECAVCGGLGITGAVERYFANDAPTRTATVHAGGWVQCPGCTGRFSIHDPRAWTGLRHTICGQKINLYHPREH